MNSTPLLLFGGSGQVGWELQRSLSVFGRVYAPARGEIDLSDPAAIEGLIHRVQPAAIVNAAAYTAVDRAEEEAALAQAVNAAAPAAMAGVAAERAIPLIHFSTDYVYSGDKDSPYVESDPTSPLSVYGASKLAGDLAIQSSGTQYLILRTAWVYSGRGRNFLKTMLRLARERPELRVVADQYGVPTSAELLADVTAQLLPRLLSDVAAGGLYHCAAKGETTWHGFARMVVEQAARWEEGLAVSPADVIPIATDAYPVPARRPAYSVLNCDRLEQDFGLNLPPWEIQVKRCIRELLEA